MKYIMVAQANNPLGQWTKMQGKNEKKSGVRREAEIWKNEKRNLM